MKFNRNLLVAPMFAVALALSACSSDSDPLEVDDDTTADEVAGEDSTGDDTAADIEDTTDDSDADADNETVVGGADTTDGDSDTEGEDAAGEDLSDEDSGDEDSGEDATGGEDAGDATDVDSVFAQQAVIASIDATFSSSVIDLVGTTAPFTMEGNLHPGVSDTIVRAFEDNYYVIRRFMSDTVTAYNLADNSTPLFDVSTNSDTEAVSSNPHDLIFLNAEKAYLLRYGSPIMWVVNPTATDPSEFMLSTIDLSVFDADGVPESTRGVIVGDELFIVMQRLDGFTPVQNGIIGVVDTVTDTLIDPIAGDSLPGIEIPAFNPAELSLDEETGTIFISAFGDFGAFDGSRPPAFSGGLVAFDTESLEATLLIDDVEATGRINNVEVVSSTQGYIITSSGFGTGSLDQFSPVTGRIEALGVAGLSGIDVVDIEVGPQGNLWVGIADPVAPRLVVIDPSDNSIVTEIATSLDPRNIAFTQ